MNAGFQISLYSVKRLSSVPNLICPVTSLVLLKNEASFDKVETLPLILAKTFLGIMTNWCFDLTSAVFSYATHFNLEDADVSQQCPYKLDRFGFVNSEKKDGISMSDD